MSISNIYAAVELQEESVATLASILPKALSHAHAANDLMLLPLVSFHATFKGGESLSLSDLTRLMHSSGGSLMLLDV